MVKPSVLHLHQRLVGRLLESLVSTLAGKPFGLNLDSDDFPSLWVPMSGLSGCPFGHGYHDTASRSKAVSYFEIVFGRGCFSVSPKLSVRFCGIVADGDWWGRE